MLVSRRLVIWTVKQFSSDEHKQSKDLLTSTEEEANELLERGSCSRRRVLKVFKKKVVKKSLGATPVCGSHLDVWADILFCSVISVILYVSCFFFGWGYLCSAAWATRAKLPVI